jgi:signal transduction histidine kinase
VRTAYDLQRNFVGNVSHELRTPLTSIEGFSQALLDGVSTSPEERKRSLEIINHESKRLVRVLRDLLLLSQIDAGEVKPEKKKVDLVDFMRNLANLYTTRAQDAGVVLNVDLPGSLEVNTDPDRLERVMTNLLENAIKYTGAGGSVKLRAQAPDDSVRIDISDTGPGIPEDQLERIFDRFHRVEQSRAQKHGGSGLGLSISKELVETLGGTIEVASTVGQGSTFTVVLPVDGG